MSNAIVITRPDHDPGNNYLYFWTQELVALAKKKNFSIHDLKSKKANKATFNSHLRSSLPTFIFLNGHGSADKVYGYDDLPILECEKHNNLLKNSVIYARSCRSARVLGNFLIVNNLAQTFIGFKNDFMMLYRSDLVSKPLSDQLAQLFLKPSNMIARALIKGHSTKEAFKRSRMEFQKNISKCMSSRASKDEQSCVFMLWQDLKALTLLGNESIKITG